MLSVAISIFVAGITLTSALDLHVTSVLDDSGLCPSKGIHECTYRAALQAAIDYNSYDPITIYLQPTTYRIEWKALPRLFVRFGKAFKKRAAAPRVIGRRRTRLRSSNA